MKFAKWAFRITGTLGMLQILPLYFSEAQIASAMPPAITHPEFYYDFAGVMLAWQIAFLIISSDPLRYRPLMPAAMVEKATFVCGCFWLLAQGRLPGTLLYFALLDLCYGLSFVAAYLTTWPKKVESWSSLAKVTP